MDLIHRDIQFVACRRQVGETFETMGGAEMAVRAKESILAALAPLTVLASWPAGCRMTLGAQGGPAKRRTTFGLN